MRFYSDVTGSDFSDPVFWFDAHDIVFTETVSARRSGVRSNRRSVRAVSGHLYGVAANTVCGGEYHFLSFGPAAAHR